MVRALDCQSRGLGFNPRYARHYISSIPAMDNTKTPKAELYKRGKEYWMKKCDRLKEVIDFVNSKLSKQEEYIQSKKDRIEKLCYSLEQVEKKLSRANTKVSIYQTISWILALVIIINVCVRV